MSFIHKYYACILGLIRLLGIGVGNEHARASTVFSFTLYALIVMVFEAFGKNIKEIGVFLFLILILGIFLSCYFFFSKEKNILTIDNWLIKTSLKEKTITGIISLCVFLLITVFFLKFYV